jgi:beta-glucuronidase
MGGKRRRALVLAGAVRPRSLLLLLAVALVGAGALAGAASAQAQAAQGPINPYLAQPPTKGALYRDGQDGRYLLGGLWLYRADRSDVGLAEGWWRNLASLDGWSPVTIPNSFNAGDFSTAGMDGYVGWYRRDFTLPAHAFARYVPSSARRWIIRFESVNYRATVWLNGRPVGSHVGADLPFEFDLHELRAGVNRLIVRVDNRSGSRAPQIGPSRGWWNYGGILREVYLRSVEIADIERVMIRPVLVCARCGATIEAQAVIRNLTRSPQTVQLAGSYGDARLDFGAATIGAYSSWTARASVRIAHPHLWSPIAPFLYRATLRLADANGQALGGYATSSGIRKIAVVGGHLLLNGQPLHLRGVALHEQNISTGAALSPTQIGQLIGWVRELGAHMIRVQYPPNPQLLELADRYGILIWDEIQLWRPSTAALRSRSVVAAAESDLEQNIIDNQNHPSMLVWSIGNEFPTPVPAAEKRYISAATRLAHKLDPTRPVGTTISDWPGLPCQSGAYAPLDVLGVSDYFGWFSAGGGTTDDRDGLSPFLDSVRACYPREALIVDEFGFDGSRDGPVEERGTYAFQANTVAFHLGVFATKPWLSGASYWLLQDWAAWPGWDGGDPRGTPPFVQKGLVDFQGNPKPAFAVVQQIYRSTVQVG